MVVAVAVAVAVVVVALAAVAVVVQKQRCMLRIDLIVTSMFCKIGLQIHALSIPRVDLNILKIQSNKGSTFYRAKNEHPNPRSSFKF